MLYNALLSVCFVMSNIQQLFYNENRSLITSLSTCGTGCHGQQW